MFNPLSSKTKLLVVFVTVLGLALVNHAVSSAKDRTIESLVETVDSQSAEIQLRDQQIAELEHYRMVEEGLRQVIAVQNERYIALEKEYEKARLEALVRVSNLDETSRSRGDEIDVMWDMYRGETP